MFFVVAGRNSSLPLTQYCGWRDSSHLINCLPFLASEANQRKKCIQSSLEIRQRTKPVSLCVKLKLISDIADLDWILSQPTPITFFPWVNFQEKEAFSTMIISQEKDYPVSKVPWWHRYSKQ